MIRRLLLLVAVYACIELREFVPRGTDLRRSLKDWHFALGLVVFAVTLVRLALRASSKAPPIIPPPPAWQQWLARRSTGRVAPPAMSGTQPQLGDAPGTYVAMR